MMFRKPIPSEFFQVQQKEEMKEGGFDLSIDEETAARFKELAIKNEKSIESSNEHLESVQKRWSQYPDFGHGEELPVRDYLKKYPEILGKYRNLTRLINGVEFTQQVRPNTSEEQSLLSQIRSIAKGKFVEILIVLVKLKDGSILKRFVFSASGNEVEQSDIDRELNELRTSIGEGMLEQVNIMHNHPDQLEKTTMWSVQDSLEEGEVDAEVGLISTNSLTDRDIKTADNIRQNFFAGLPVTMSAISENGLTYTYKANTAKYINHNKRDNVTS